MKKTILWSLLLFFTILYGCSPRLEGTYVSDENPLYKSLTFKGENTVVVRDAFFGMEHVSEYVIDDNLIRIKAEPSDLLFEIISRDTLSGEGFAEGLYVKE